ncbi:unnamed protein product [Amoebophrya sp. A120]|nr:unnamed protein product [Amoebophrya sp. A120]|eukprot:GSA120T00017134001.1
MGQAAMSYPLHQRKMFALVASSSFFAPVVILLFGCSCFFQFDLAASSAATTNLPEVYNDKGQLKCYIDSDTSHPKCNHALETDIDLSFEPKTMSVVLPCANEHEYARKTVQAVFKSFPKAERDKLLEIIVVDDGSSPRLDERWINKKVQRKFNTTVVRHDTTHGLIGAKKSGGDAAKGDIVVFFDCHVAPQKDWYKPFFSKIGENFKRIIVPMITDLDIDTWTERLRNNGQAKCYLTFDADFKWFNSADDDVPVLSGGLLGMSRRWWHMTGGYDPVMRGWGGENLDQALRSWLCGGEVKNAPTSYVAHMWRVPHDSRTTARFTTPPNSVMVNRFRAAKAWTGLYADKMSEEFKYGPYARGVKDPDEASGKAPWYGNISNILEIKNNLQCRDFSWFIWRFGLVYLKGGLVPEYTFMLRWDHRTAVTKIEPESNFKKDKSLGVDGFKSIAEREELVKSTDYNNRQYNPKKNDMCLQYMKGPGTSGDGRGHVEMKPCDSDNHRQRFHWANKSKFPGMRGIRAWNTDQCLDDIPNNGKVTTYVCDVAGEAMGQQWGFDLFGNLIKNAHPGSHGNRHRCMDGGKLNEGTCRDANTKARGYWRMENYNIPKERELYERAWIDTPEIFQGGKAEGRVGTGLDDEL